MLATLGFAALAGMLSVLSPCVLPILPIVLAGAVAESRLGPLALAAGLALSFGITGIAIATVGFAAGIDAGPVRLAGALLMIAFGVVLLVPRLQETMAATLAPVSRLASERFATRAASGIAGQFVIGLVLGLVWTPCVGPTLGAASVMAARGENLAQVAATMVVFGIGAAIPLAALGALPRSRLVAARRGLAFAGQSGKAVLGILLLVAGALVVTGADKWLETILLEASPEWLLQLTTRI